MMIKINQSLNHTWKVTNVVMYCDTRTDVHIQTQSHTYKKKYIYIIIVILILVMTRRISDFTIISLCYITRIGITLSLL